MPGNETSKKDVVEFGAKFRFEVEFTEFEKSLEIVWSWVWISNPTLSCGFGISELERVGWCLVRRYRIQHTDMEPKRDAEHISPMWTRREMQRKNQDTALSKKKEKKIGENHGIPQNIGYLMLSVMDHMSDIRPGKTTELYGMVGCSRNGLLE